MLKIAIHFFMFMYQGLISRFRHSGEIVKKKEIINKRRDLDTRCMEKFMYKGIQILSMEFCFSTYPRGQ